MKRVARSAIVQRPADSLYALVERIEDYPHFLPWCTGSTVNERTEAHTVATIEIGVGGLGQSFTTENFNRPGESIEMRLVRGPFRRFQARWDFTPLGTSATRIAFCVEYEFSSALLARTLEPVFRRIADTMVDAFTKRAEREPDAGR